MADQRSFWPTELTGAAAAGLAAIASSRSWASTSAATQAVAKGSDVAPLGLALALVALAAWGGLLVTRLRGRRVLTLLGLAASLGVVAAVLPARGRALDAAVDASPGPVSGLEATTSGWYYCAVAAAVVTALLYVVALLKVAGWPEMSARYDAPAGRPAEQTDLWKALDEGHDPTT